MDAQNLKIPKARVAVLIGKKGEIKQKIEELTQTKLEVFSASGEVLITPLKESEALNVLKACSIVKAVGRGFSPEKALHLLDDDYYLEIMDLQEILGKQGKKLEIRKGRVIGKSGATRDKIEELTETFISVYGKTIAFIGKPENIAVARQAVEKLIDGSKHEKVYEFLALKTSERKRFEL